MGIQRFGCLGNAGFGQAHPRLQDEDAANCYDCLGCKLCWGTEATRIIAETYGDSILECGDTTCAPHSAEGATVSSISSAKISWPPYPGDYVVGDPSGSIAVCTLASHDLTNTLMTLGEPGIAITGKCNTENIGVEKAVLNILTNPHIRWLILCGNEAEGHRPGDAFLKLKEHGVDAAIPRDPMVDSPAIPSLPTFERIEARAPKRLGLDPAGFFIILPNKMTGVIVCEHYDNSGRLMHVIEGKDSALIAATAVERGLITRLDHAAYLGRELAKAEFTIRTGSIYTQDAALGELPQDEKCSNSTCKCH